MCRINYQIVPNYIGEESMYYRVSEKSDKFRYKLSYEIKWAQEKIHVIDRHRRKFM